MNHILHNENYDYSSNHSIIYEWKMKAEETLALCLKIDKDTMICQGMALDVMRLKEVIELGVAKPSLMHLDGNLVKVKYNKLNKVWVMLDPNSQKNLEK